MIFDTKHKLTIATERHFWGAIGSVVGSIAGGLLGNKSTDETNAANAAENEKNREFNARESYYSFLRQKELMNMQMEYDSAKKQRERLQEAGLNPYMMMDGSNAGTASSASANSASAPSVIPMQSKNYDFMQQAAMNAAQINLMKAQANNLDQDSKKKQKETEGQGYTNDILKSDAAYRDAFNSGQLTTQYVTIDNIKADTDVKNASVVTSSFQNKLLDAQASVERKKLEEINKNMERVNEEIENLKTLRVGLTYDNVSKAIEAQYKEPYMQETIRNIASQANYTNAQAKEITSLLALKAALYGSQINDTNASAELKKADKILRDKYGLRADMENDIFRLDYDAKMAAGNTAHGRFYKRFAAEGTNLLNAVTLGMPDMLSGILKLL